MKFSAFHAGLIGILLCTGCGGPKTEQRLDDIQSTGYLESREVPELIYPEGVDAPERSSAYKIPPLPPEAAGQDYDINKLLQPPDLLGREDDAGDQTDRSAFAARPVREPGIYAGVGLGRLDFKGRYDGVSYDDNPVAWNVYAGYRLNDYLGIELAWKQSDGIESGNIPGSGFDRLKISSEFDATIVR